MIVRIIQITFFTALLAFAGSAVFAQHLKLSGLFVDPASKENTVRFVDGRLLSFPRSFVCVNDTTGRIIFSDSLPDFDTVDVFCDNCSYHNLLCEVFSLGDSYLFCGISGAALVDKQSMKVTAQYKYPGRGSYYFFRMSGDTVFGIEGTPADDITGFSFRPLYRTSGSVIREISEVKEILLPPVNGFDLMYMQPRAPFAMFRDYFVLADPCLMNMYYYGKDGELTRTVRLDSLLELKGVCSQLESYAAWRNEMNTDFSRIIGLEAEGNSIAWLDNVEGMLAIKIADGKDKCRIYISDPDSLDFKLVENSSAPKFDITNLPAHRWSTLWNGYVIDKIEEDIRTLNFSQFPNYEEFDLYIGLQPGTAATYLVRRIDFND